MVAKIRKALEENRNTGLIAIVGLGAIALIGISSAMSRGRRQPIDDTAT